MQASNEVGFRFQVTSASGGVETLSVDAASALIGTAAHCEVRLSTDDASHEHIEVFAERGAVCFTTRSGEAPPLLDGVPVAAGHWPPGCPLTLGGTTLTVEVVDLAPARRTRSPFWMLAVVPLAGGVAAFLATRSAPASETEIPPAPALLDPPAGVCPSPPSPTLAAFAAERARIGYAKRERSAFYPADGVEAVAHLETAAACFRAAAKPDAEREAWSAASTLRARLDEEYHVRRVRVEHAFRVGDPFGAKRELTVLVPLMAHRRGAYVDWLASVDRYATAAVDARSSRRL